MRVESRAAQIAEEQAYFDNAARYRERARSAAELTAGAGVHAQAARMLKLEAAVRNEALGALDEAVAVGRIDDESGERRYVGRHLIRGDDGDVLVVSWKAPAAVPYFQANADNTFGLVRKRTFRCTGNTVDDFEDVLFAEVARVIAGGPDAALLRSLAEGRTGRMGDIVATIQAAQYELISAEPDQVLVLDGGPGTGKTAVALHRLSWLLANTPGLRADNVLVVGPNPTFTRYIARVLPSLGDDSVAQRDITQLAPDVHRGRSEPVEVARLKGDARMAGLLGRALAARIGVPEQLERLMVDGRFVSVPGSEIAEALELARTAPGPYVRRRALLRDRLVQLLLDRGTSPAAGRIPAVEALVERLWPQLSPAAFLRDLFGSRERLLAAGGSEFTAREVAGLRRRAADRLSEETWTPDDLPLLDEVEHLITGAPQRYAHIVVDEAQDLSPMQLRSIARRSSTGGFTLAGDLAQSTGPWARDSWDSVTAALAGAAPATVGRLRYGYRVPRQVYDLAALLLPMAAPGTEPPEVVRDGPEAPGIHRVDPAERAARAVGLALAHAAERRFTGIVCPASCRPAVEAALAANGVSWSSADRGELGLAINLVSPHEAKGLEFDAVVVVEPEEIVASDQRGHRLLYVALTRTIGYLDIVCAGEPLPMATPIPTEPEPVPKKDVRVDTSATVQDYAEEIILWVRDTVPRPLWAAVLREAAKELGRRPD